MYLPTVDGKYFRSTPSKESEHKLRNPTPPHPQFNVECSASGVWFCFFKPRLQHWTGGCGGRAEHNNSSQQSLRKYFPSTVGRAGLSLPPNIQKSGPTRSIYNASEWNALGAWRQCFLHPVCCYGFSKAARPQKHQAGHLEYKEIQSSSRLWKQMSQKYETRTCGKVALRYCRTLPRFDQDRTNAVRLLANIFVAQKNSFHAKLTSLCVVHVALLQKLNVQPLSWHAFVRKLV